MNRKNIVKFLGIVLGCFLYAAGVALFLDPNNLAPGGLIGISVISFKVLYKFTLLSDCITTKAN